MALAAAVWLLLIGGGCGADDGVGEGAAATVYAASATCRQAARALRGQGDEVGSVTLRVRCLPAVEARGRVDLAQVGKNARRASEDSTAIAYIGEIEPAATRFSRPILEEAGIAQLPHQSGSLAMHSILNAVHNADTSSSSLREAVNDQLH